MDKIAKRVTIAKKFLQGYSVKELADKYGLADSTIAGYLRTHINKNGRVVSQPPFQSKILQLPGETWRRIPIASKWKYEASSLGRIKSYTYKTPKIVGGNVKYGYRSIDYKHKDDFRRAEFAHTLILLAWHGPRPAGNYVGVHLDHDSWNNKPANLRWMTKKEAQRHSRNSPYMEILKKRVLAMPDAKKRNARYGKLSRKEVASIKQKVHNGRSVLAIAKEYEIATMTVQRIHRGKIWSDVLPQLTRKKIEGKTIATGVKEKIADALREGKLNGRQIAAANDVDPTTVSRIKKTLQHANA